MPLGTKSKEEEENVIRIRTTKIKSKKSSQDKKIETFQEKWNEAFVCWNGVASCIKNERLLFTWMIKENGNLLFLFCANFLSFIISLL